MIDKNIKDKFEYENNKMDLCIDWQRVEILTKGDFLLNIIIEDIVKSGKIQKDDLTIVVIDEFELRRFESSEVIF